MTDSGNFQEHKQELRGGFSLPFFVLTALFFMWGLVIGLNTILFENIKTVFQLSLNQALFIQFSFFAMYLIFSVPAGKFIDALGYRNGIIAGLLIGGIGGLLYFPAADQQSFNMLMTATIMLGIGITILQVAANPYIVLYGDPSLADERLCLKQGFNSLGAMLAPLFLTIIVFSPIHSNPELLSDLTPEQIKSAFANDVKLPYILAGLAMIVLAVFMAFSKLPKFNTKSWEPNVAGPERKYVIEFRHLILGAFAIFAYLGAEIAIGSHLNRTIRSVGGFDELTAINYLSIYFGGMMVGRFVGAWVLPRFNLHNAVAFCAAGSAVLVLGGAFLSGTASMWALLLVGIFNSILFPAIFTLGLSGLGKFSEEGSSVLIMGGVGGAVIPVLMNNVIASSGTTIGLLIPVVCFVFVVYYALVGSKYQKIDPAK